MSNTTSNIVAGVAIGAVTAGFLYFRTRGAAAAPLGSGTPVIVELFSAEGCSSCPPADEYIATLDRTQPISGVSVIALEMHVDYWDRLGWTDPYGSHAYSERQATYANVLENHKVFTPEIIFDGDKLMVGGDEEIARTQMTASASETKAKVALEVTGRGKVSITISDAPAPSSGDSFDAWLAVTESHLESTPSAGENNGKTLSHAPIVRDLRDLGPLTDGTYRGDAAIDIAASWKPGALRYVAFVQAARSRKIVGAAARNAKE